MSSDKTKAPGPTVESLARLHSKAVLAVCLARTRSVHDAEDAMQEVFLRAMRSFGSLRDPTRARAWLLQIARRACIDQHRRRKKTVPISAQAPGRARLPDPRIHRLHEALSEIPDNYREVILLYYMDGRNCAGVADCLGITCAAVRQRLVRGRLMLHDLLMEDSR